MPELLPVVLATKRPAQPASFTFCATVTTVEAPEAAVLPRILTGE